MTNYKVSAEIGNDVISSEKQLDLFKKIDNESGLKRYSNGFEILDTAPRFVRGNNKFTLVDEMDEVELIRPFVFDGELHTLRIQPYIANKVIKGKKTKIALWPSDREEKLERAILKLAVDGMISYEEGHEYSKVPIYHVTFTLYKLRQELKQNGNEMSYKDVKESLDILTKTSIDITKDSDSKHYTLTGTYFPTRKTVEKKTGDRTELIMLQLTDIHARAISDGTYRQFLYSRVGRYKRPMSRWLDMHLVHTWRSAGFEGKKTKTIKLSEILNGFGYERGGRKIGVERRDVRECLIDLANATNAAGEKTNIISFVPRAKACAWLDDENKTPIDYEYELHASPHFIHEQKIGASKASGLRKLREMSILESKLDENVVASY